VDTEELCNRLASTAGADYDCRRCGACCLGTADVDGYVALTADEAAGLRALGLPLVQSGRGVYLGTQAYDGPGGGCACVAFDGAPGFPCGCLIYEDRPEKCRQFEMGSVACRRARLRVGLPV
jgi:uncharacterized protein